MGKFAPAEVDADMADVLRRPEKNEITGLQGWALYLFRVSDLVRCGSRQLQAEEILIDPLNKTGTVNP